MIDDNISHEYIIRYLRDLLPKRGGLTGEMEQYAKAHSVPISQPETMKLLEVLIRLGRIRSVLEIGCAQAADVLALGAANGWVNGSCRKDYGSNDRAVLLQKPEKSC